MLTKTASLPAGGPMQPSKACSSEGAQVRPGTTQIDEFHSLLFSSHIVTNQHVQLQHPMLFGYLEMDAQQGSLTPAGHHLDRCVPFPVF